MSWDKTRICWCGNCRFHSLSEPGWDKCPDMNKKGAVPRQLWVKNNNSSVDLEARDRQYLKEQAKHTVIESINDD